MDPGRSIAAPNALRAATPTLVVATWDHWPVTERFIASFRESTRHYWNLAFVDNGSTDGTPERLVEAARRADLDIALLTNATNEGCSRAWNRGIRAALAAQSPLVGVFNNDVVFSPGWDEGLLAFWRRHHERHPVFSPYVMVNALDDFRSTAASFTRRNRRRVRRAMRSDAMLIDAAVFGRVGFYDERFFVSYEDFDFYLRLVAAGIHPVVVGSSVVWHHEKSSRKDLPHAHEVEGRDLFVRKWPKGLDDPALQPPGRRARILGWVKQRLGIF